jgi:hypothetical protein
LPLALVASCCQQIVGVPCLALSDIPITGLEFVP